MGAGSLSLIHYTIYFAQLANGGVFQFQIHKDLAVKSYHLMCRTSTLQINVVFQMLLKAYSNHS